MFRSCLDPSLTKEQRAEIVEATKTDNPSKDFELSIFQNLTNENHGLQQRVNTRSDVVAAVFDDGFQGSSPLQAMSPRKVLDGPQIVLIRLN